MPTPQQLPADVTQKRLKDNDTQQSLDNVVTPLRQVIFWLKSLFKQVGNLVTLTVDSFVATTARITTLTVTTETITNLTVTSATVGSLTVTGNETVGGTLGVTGAVTGASFTGGAISGTTGNFSGGVQTGSRHAPFKGWIAATEINGGVANVPFKAILPTTAPGVALGTPTSVQTFYTTPYAGSIAGFSLKVYTGTSAGGQVTVTSTGATSNISQVVTNTQANAGFTIAVTQGTFPYVAGAQLAFRVTSTAAWSQGANAGIELQVWVYE